MRKGILGVVFAATVALGGTADVLAHGGTYSGPAGGGTPGFSGPVGGGTTGGSGGTGGGTTPGNTPGGTTGGGGGTTGPAGPGLRPVGGGGARPGGGGFGRATPGASKPKVAERTNDWDWWWELNDEPFLNLKRKVRSEANKSENRDTFLGASTTDDVAGLTLTQIRRDIVPTLKLALKDPYFDARSGAVIALGKVGDKTDVDLIDQIKPLLGDENNTVREAAAIALGMLGTKEVVPMLFDILEDTPNGRKLAGRGQVLNRHRAFAAVGIGLVGLSGELADDTAVIERLAKMVGSRQGADNDLQVAPAIALALIKSQAGVPAMKAILANQEVDEYARAHVAVALGKVGAKDALKQLVDGLTDNSNHVARSCAIALGLIVSPEDKASIRQLMSHAKSANDISTRNFCLISLGQIGSPEAVAFLAEQLMKGQMHAQTFSALALGVARFKGMDIDPRIQELVFKTFKDTKSKSEKGAYAISLGLMNYQDAKEAIRAELDEGGSQDLKGHCCTALGLLGDREALAQIRDLVRQRGDVDLRKRAAIALGLLQDTTAVEVLERVIIESDNSKAVLGAATVAMGFIGDRRAVPILTDFLTKKQGGDFVAKDVTRAFATVALGFLGDKDEIPLLSNLQRSSNFLAQTASFAELLTIL